MTRTQRAALIGLASPTVRIFKSPTGTIGEDGRRLFLFLAPAHGGPPPGTFNPAWAAGSNRLILPQ